MADNKFTNWLKFIPKYLRWVILLIFSLLIIAVISWQVLPTLFKPVEKVSTSLELKRDLENNFYSNQSVTFNEQYNYEAFVTQQIDSSNYILKIPLLNVEDEFFAPLRNSFPEIVDRKKSNPFLFDQILFFNSTQNLYTSPPINPNSIFALNYDSKQVFIYELSNVIYLTDNKFQNTQILLDYSKSEENQSLPLEESQKLKINKVYYQEQTKFINISLIRSDFKLDDNFYLLQIDTQKLFDIDLKLPISNPMDYYSILFIDELNKTIKSASLLDQTKLSQDTAAQNNLKQDLTISPDLYDPTISEKEDLIFDNQINYSFMDDGYLLINHRYITNRFWIYNLNTKIFYNAPLDIQTRDRQNTITSNCDYSSKKCLIINFDTLKKYELVFNQETSSFDINSLDFNLNKYPNLTVSGFYASSGILGTNPYTSLILKNNKFGLWYLGEFLEI
jgi:hypothetical protein